MLIFALDFFIYIYAICDLFFTIKRNTLIFLWVWRDGKEFEICKTGFEFESEHVFFIRI